VSLNGVLGTLCACSSMLRVIGAVCVCCEGGLGWYGEWEWDAHAMGVIALWFTAGLHVR
jgi:hypothetical protein